jgi:hypothetical protein
LSGTCPVPALCAGLSIWTAGYWLKPGHKPNPPLLTSEVCLGYDRRNVYQPDRSSRNRVCNPRCPDAPLLFFEPIGSPSSGLPGMTAEMRVATAGDDEVVTALWDKHPQTSWLNRGPKLGRPPISGGCHGRLQYLRARHPAGTVQLDASPPDIYPTSASNPQRTAQPHLASLLQG